MSINGIWMQGECSVQWAFEWCGRAMESQHREKMRVARRHQLKQMGKRAMLPIFVLAKARDIGRKEIDLQ
jgi:hypothetical protein